MSKGVPYSFLTRQPLPAATDLARRFAAVIGDLQRAAAARAPKHRELAPLICLLWSRLGRMVARFTAIAARAAAGTLRAPPRRRTVPAEPAAEKRPPPRRNPLPQNFAWLVRLVPEAACFGSQLQFLLAEPEMKALLEAAPQLGRILRPLCRTLGVSPVPAVVPPAPKRPAKPPKPKREKPPKEIWIRWRGIRMPGPPPKPA